MPDDEHDGFLADDDFLCFGVRGDFTVNTILEALRQIVGEPDFYKVLSGNNPTWDYAAMIEYVFACLILVIVIGSVFKVILKMFGR